MGGRSQASTSITRRGGCLGVYPVTPAVFNAGFVGSVFTKALLHRGYRWNA